MGSQNELVGGRQLIKYLSQYPLYITTWTEYGMQTRKTLNTDTFQIVIPRKMKSKFTLQGNKRLYPSESNACKLYTMQNYIIYPHLEQQIVFSMGFLSPAFTIHRTVGQGGGYFFNSSLPLPPASQTLRHQPSNYCRELTSTHSLQADLNQDPLVLLITNH